MRFGMFIPQGWRLDLVGIETQQHWQVMSDLARRLDANPTWESAWVYDHFHTTPKALPEATHEAWTLMSAFAAVTDRVRLGQMCTCMSYREPTYLAKVAATIDAISGGRVEMGIGGGWYEHEWRAYGYGFPSAGDRLGRLREGVEIFRQMWTTGSATLDGKHYQVDGALCFPQPVQTTSASNRIPIWVAGGGEKVTLKIAAQYADYTNFDGTLEGFRHKSQVLQDHCTAIGRDFAQITRSANYNVVIGATDKEVADRLAFVEDLQIKGGLPAEQAAAMRENLATQPAVGTPDKIVATLKELRDAGMSYAITYFAEAAHDTSGIELFEREVAPALAD